jgi:hypothetical protein
MSTGNHAMGNLDIKPSHFGKLLNFQPVWCSTREKLMSNEHARTPLFADGISWTYCTYHTTHEQSRRGQPTDPG